jgi:cysteine desulfurase
MAHAGRVERIARVSRLRDALIRGVLEGVPSAVLTGHPSARLPGSASFCFPGTSGEAVLLSLEERGIVCSSGSACAAGSDEPSHVLMAMGFSREVAQTAVRFTLGDGVTAEQVAEVAGAVRDGVRAVMGIGGR